MMLSLVMQVTLLAAVGAGVLEGVADDALAARGG
jgi:hypothetical protein